MRIVSDGNLTNIVFIFYCCSYNITYRTTQPLMCIIEIYKLFVWFTETLYAVRAFYVIQ